METGSYRCSDDQDFSCKSRLHTDGVLLRQGSSGRRDTGKLNCSKCIIFTTS